ncbi:MAG: hypothetical protein ACK42D_00065 [Candidatus Paceibacteria bacterium]
MPETFSRIQNIESAQSNPAEVKVEHVPKLDFFELQRRLDSLKANQPENASLAEAEKDLDKYDQFRRNIAWESDRNRQVSLESQLDKLDYLTKVNKILSEFHPEISPESEVVDEAELDTNKAENIVTDKEKSDNLEDRVSYPLVQMQKQVERLLGHTTRIREEHGFNITEARRVANLPGFASARKNLLDLQKEIKQAQEDGVEFTKEDLNKIRGRIAKHIVAMRSKELEDQLSSPELPTVAVFGMQIPVAGIEGRIGAQAFHKGLLTLKQVNRLPVNPDTQRAVERMLKITGYVIAEGLTEAEADELHDLAQMISQPETLVPVNNGEQLYKELNDKLAKSREKLPVSAWERAGRMSKVLSFMLAGAVGSSAPQPAGQHAEGYVGTEDMFSGGQLQGDIESATAPIVAPQFVEVDVGSGSEVVSDSESIDSPADLVVETNIPPALESAVITESVEISPVSPLFTPNISEQPVVYDESVPSPSMSIEEVPHQSESIPSLLITVPEDCTVSQAIARAYEEGLLNPYLTRTYSSTNEFMQAYWAFDQIVNNHPELVKHILEIDSGNTNIIPAGGSFNAREIIAVINGQRTVTDILEQHSPDAQSELTSEEAEVLDRNIDVQKTVLEEVSGDTVRSVEQPLTPVVDTLVTPQAVEAYRNDYKGGEEAWERDFDTYIKTYLPTKTSEGWLNNWFNTDPESVGDIYEHISESNMTMGQFNKYRDGDARELREYLRPLKVPISDFRALQVMLEEIKQTGTVLMSDDMTVLEVLEAAFVDRHSRLIANKSQ